MSAFIVDSDVMDRVLRIMSAGGPERYEGLAQFAGETIRPSDLPAAPGLVRVALDSIGRKLYAMNVESVMQRYPDCRSNPDNMPGPSNARHLATDYTYTRRRGTVSLAEMVDGYKAVSCLLYQCCEGNVDESALYRELSTFHDTLAHAIVTRLPAYAAAAW